MKTKHALLTALTLAAALLSGSAHADLAKDVADARARTPEVFHAVDDVVSHAEEIDARSRVRGMPLTQRFRALGPNALYPMLEIVSGAKPLPAALSTSAEGAVRVGLLEAIGSIRDDRAVPVLERELAQASDVRIVRAASTALARIGSDAAYRILEREQLAAQKTNVERERAILEGLHDCRRTPAAKLLVARLDAGADDATARILLRSLGGAANAWAWRALPASPEMTTTQNIASSALLRAFATKTGDLRETAAKALLVVDDPTTPQQIAQLRTKASPDLAGALDELARRFRDNPARLAP